MDSLTKEQIADNEDGTPLVYVHPQQVIDAWRNLNPEKSLPSKIRDSGLFFTALVPEEDRRAITREFINRRIPVSEALIVALWLEGQSEENTLEEGPR